jgi:hypothetical protein
VAIWQLDLQLLPKGSPAPKVDPNEGFDVAPIPGHISAEEIGKVLTPTLGKPHETLTDHLVWGREEANCIHASFEAGYLRECRARIDARIQTEQFAQSVCDLAQRLGCSFFLPETGAVIPAALPAVSSAVARSRAAAYAQDPQSVLEAIAREHGSRNAS